VSDALDRMTRRLTRGSAFMRSIEEIEASYAALEADFLAFFPELVDFCAGWNGSLRAPVPVEDSFGR
jgi:acyl carrier protein phosphodiesterase